MVDLPVPEPPIDNLRFTVPNSKADAVEDHPVAKGERDLPEFDGVVVNSSSYVLVWLQQQRDDDL
jgi:hypothetical protein